jgi:GntR family transcriptional regulator, transcriptional repressor for pyruvate dehydrogenase complex
VQESEPVTPEPAETTTPYHDPPGEDNPPSADLEAVSENRIPAKSISVAPLERRGVANDGIELLKAMILRGDLTPLQRLPPERDLAELLGISRSTLRESIRALIALNILESRHGDGTFVTSLAPELLAKPLDFVLRLEPRYLSALTDVRMILEPAITGLATGRMTEELFDLLEAILDEKEIADENDEERAIDLDFQFHRTLVEATDNPILIAIIASVSGLARTSRLTTTPVIRVESPRAGTDDLRNILRALRAGDPVQAAAAMSAHLQRISRALGNSHSVQQGTEPNRDS